MRMPAASVSTTALPATAFGASRLPACPPLRAAPDGPPCRHSQLPAPWLLPHPAAVLHTHSLRRDVPGFKTHLSHYLSVLTLEQMMDALVNYGAVSVVVTVQGFPLGPSMQTIICAPISGPNDPYLDQVVVVVGWQPCQVSGGGGRRGQCSVGSPPSAGYSAYYLPAYLQLANGTNTDCWIVQNRCGPEGVERLLCRQMFARYCLLTSMWGTFPSLTHVLQHASSANNTVGSVHTSMQLEICAAHPPSPSAAGAMCRATLAFSTSPWTRAWTAACCLAPLPLCPSSPGPQCRRCRVRTAPPDAQGSVGH